MAIIGGGVIGLAAACATANRGHTTCLIERHPRNGLEASTHNSGVIHAGIYYPTDSLKARMCVEGRDRLYLFCHKNEIPYRKCGKLIVSTSTKETERLEALTAQGRANGVDDLEVVEARFVKQREPYVTASAAIWSPSTGIVEAEALIRSLVQLAIKKEVALLLGTRVKHGSTKSQGIRLETTQEEILARTVINAGGLYADEISQSLGGETFTVHPVRGDYAELTPSARHLVNALVYPLPEQTGQGLGVHLTRTTWDSVMLGPTARHQTSKSDYESNREPLKTFYEATQQMLPALKPDQLRAGGSGIRARGAPANRVFSDFRIRRDHSIKRLIHAVGIDSPGLTASLAIAERLADLVNETLA